MNTMNTLGAACLLVGLAAGLPAASAASKKPAPDAPLAGHGQQLETSYAATLVALRAEIIKSLPNVSEHSKAALQKARDAVKAAEKQAEAAQQALGKVQTAKALVDHAKGKWIGGAEKGIAAAEAALKKATTEAERQAARTDLAKWQANKEDGIKALKERQAALDQAKIDEPRLMQANQAAQAALAQARTNERTAAAALLAEVGAFLASDRLDAKLVKGAVLAGATPRGLAEFAQQGKEQESLIEKLLADDSLMKEMLVAGGANSGKYGRAMQIYAAIQQASPKAREGVLHRLALATSLEHAVPINQVNAKDQTNAPTIVDPVKRYLHYEKAYLTGELDPAFKSFTTWEYRMVVDCDAPDQILAWGREMLRTYRPDHVSNPDYGWRYSGAVRTDVRYGSQNVKDDLPSLNNYQNIPMNGGVCGRRAFFGRFILKSFGIPTWGVTQHKHAAVSHWTPAGWVVNLGAGFPHSWWDKEEAPRSGSDFLLETQAREHGLDYVKVLRAQWVSLVLGEPAYNDRRQIAGGLWSSLGHYQQVALASKAVALGPLGQELAEANEPQGKEKLQQGMITDADKRIAVSQHGAITIPAVACSKPTGSSTAMKSSAGGMQLHASGGFKAQYAFETAQSGRYMLTAQVATLQEGQKFLFTANDSNPPVEATVPYTIGMWQKTKPVEISLIKGRNVLNFAVRDGSRGVTIKEFTLTPVK